MRLSIDGNELPASPTTTSAPLSPLLAPASPPGEGPKYDLDTELFTAAVFSVEDFLEHSKHDRGLEEIDKHLRYYLKDLQSSMVALINDDYTEFLKLSSSLSAVAEVLAGIENDQEAIRKTCTKYADQFASFTNVLNAKKDEVVASRGTIIDTDSTIEVLNSLNTALDTVSKPTTSIDELVSLVASLQAHDPKSARVKDLLRSVFDAIGSKFTPQLRLDNSTSWPEKLKAMHLLRLVGYYSNAVEIVAVRFVNVDLREGSDVAEVIVRRVTSTVSEKLNEISRQITALPQSPDTVPALAFYEKAALHFVFSLLQSSLSHVTSAESAAFQPSYEAVVAFLRTFPRRHHHRDTIHAIVSLFEAEKFISQASAAELTAFRDLVSFGKLAITVVDGRNVLETTEAYRKTRSAILSKDRLLTGATRFAWRLRGIVDEEYVVWLEKLATELARPVAAGEAVNGLERWKTIILSATNPLTTNRAVGQMSDELSAATSKYETQLMLRLETIHHSIRELLHPAVYLALAGIVSGVNDIPKRYRWTKHPAPTEASEYVKHIESFADEVRSFATASGWQAASLNATLAAAFIGLSGDFCDKAAAVLDAVERTGASLSLLKKRRGGENAQAEDEAGDSDEAKMKAQLAFDAQAILNLDRQLGVEASVLERVEAIYERANSAFE